MVLGGFAYVYVHELDRTFLYELLAWSVAQFLPTFLWLSALLICKIAFGAL
jgi:hypothetical protein